MASNSRSHSKRSFVSLSEQHPHWEWRAFKPWNYMRSGKSKGALQKRQSMWDVEPFYLILHHFFSFELSCCFFGSLSCCFAQLTLKQSHASHYSMSFCIITRTMNRSHLFMCHPVKIDDVHRFKSYAGVLIEKGTWIYCLKNNNFLSSTPIIVYILVALSLSPPPKPAKYSLIYALNLHYLPIQLNC